MGMVVERGFTVIELMLFLAISGLLLVGLMMGVGNNITQQRYRDDVVSFKSLLQNQYAEVLTPQNISSSVVCLRGPLASPTPTPSTEPRGTTGCVILGRAVQIEKSGDSSKATIFNVIGTEPATPNYNNGDLDTFNQYGPYVSYEDTQTDVLNVTVKSIDNRTDVVSTIVILRSPASGLVRVLLSSNPTTINPRLNLSNIASTLSLCINGDTGSMPTQVISINPAIAGGGSITARDSAGVECP